MSDNILGSDKTPYNVWIIGFGRDFWKFITRKVHVKFIQKNPQIPLFLLNMGKIRYNAYMLMAPKKILTSQGVCSISSLRVQTFLNCLQDFVVAANQYCFSFVVDTSRLLWETPNPFPHWFRNKTLALLRLATLSSRYVDYFIVNLCDHSEKTGRVDWITFGLLMIKEHYFRHGIIHNTSLALNVS